MEKVLLIDDHVELCPMLTAYLRKNAFCVTTAHRGHNGMLKALQERWALVLLDVMLP